MVCRVQLADIRCEDRRCISLRLLEIGGIEEGIPKAFLEVPELIKRESDFGLLAG